MANSDIEISSISYTNKDFGQLYPEVLDLAKQLTNKWDPSQSNESDPGVVLLKEAAFVADHNNYNIDKNILENFLPSATQDRSVRNITEMNGYTPRYYVAATGDVSFTFRMPEEDAETYNEYLVDGFTIPKFSIVVTDENNTVAYTQIDDLVVPSMYTSTKSGSYAGQTQDASATFIEGTLQKVTVNNSSVIKLENLDDNNRLYLPETMVAQNGVYIENINISDYSGYWERNNYLLTLPSGTHAYKIDYDSIQGLPYVEFPSDISSLIGDGLYVSYISTSGVSGNVSAKTLTKISSPTSVTVQIGLNAVDVYMSDFTTVNNTSSINNGKDPETIDEMYKSFKKFVGTFDTLVTPLDYTNCIYNAQDENGNYLISNGYVTDRRNDYNKALNVLTHDNNGDYFKNISIKPCVLNFKGIGATLPGAEDSNKGDLFYVNATSGGSEIGLYVYTTEWIDTNNKINLNDFTVLTDAMSPFDLSIYGLSALGSYNAEYPELALNNSFKPITSGTTSTLRTLKDEYIEESKCLSHTYNDPGLNDIYCFKVYTPLKIVIYPYNKVSETERKSIIENIYKALTNSYNPRQLEFGENINILDVKETIIAADPKIKTADVQFVSKSLKALEKTGEKSSTEYEVFPAADTSLLYQLVAKNVLAGRVCLFDFYDNFDFDFGQVNGKIEEYNSYVMSTNLNLNVSKSTKVSTETQTMIVNTFHIDSTILSSGKYNLRYKLTANSSIAPGATVKLNGIGEKLIIETTDANKEKFERDYIVDTNVIYEITNNLNETTLNKDATAYTKIEDTGSITIVEKKIIGDTTESTENLAYTLNENEVVQIIHPNYYSENSYSTYIWYRYIYTGLDTNHVILANAEHVLDANETIVLIYTDNGVEQTKFLTEGTTIRTSFNLAPTTSGTNKNWVDQSGALQNSPFKQLTASQTIDTRVMMTTELTSTNVNCYWIVDNSDNQLFNDGNVKILGTNEYFIYSNSALTEFMIYGAGTRLEKSALDENSWSYSTEKQTIEIISNEGANSLKDIWIKQNFSTEAPLDITEMTVITLSENDTLRIIGCDETTEDWVINNTWKTVNATIIYTANGVQETLPNIYDFYKIRSRLDLNCSKSSPQALKSDRQVVTINGTQYKCRTDSSTGKVIPLYIQSSIPVSLIGNDDMYLWDEVDFYLYEKETQPATTTTVGITPGNVSYTFTVLDVEKQILIPVYMDNDAVDVYVEIIDNSGSNYAVYDYNIGSLPKKSTTEPDKYKMKGLVPYFLTFIPKESMVGKTSTIRFSWDNTTSKNESLYVKWKFRVINGFKIGSTKYNNGGINEYLDNLDIDSILSTMSEIINNSDKPSTKFNYAYSLDNTLAINLDRYNYKEGSSTIRPFSNPEIMWDINNVANHMTIQQIDIANSDISVTDTMLSGSNS